MTDVDLAKVKRNVATMVQKGAPESDIDSYISQSGTTIDAVKNFKAPTEENISYTHGGLPFKSEQEPLKPQNFLDAAMMVPAGAAEGAVMKGAGALENIIAKSSPKIAERLAEKGATRTVANTAKATAAGAAGGATYNATTGRDPVTGAEIGAGLGAGGAAIPAIAKGVGNIAKATGEDLGMIKEGWSARDDAALDAAYDSLEVHANQSAANLRKMGVSLKPDVSQALMKHIDEELKDFGEQHPRLHGSTMEILAEMKQQSPKGMSINSFDNYRKMLRQEANKGGENGKLAREVMDTMRDAAQQMVNKSPEGEGKQALKELYNYVDNWSKAQRFDTLAAVVKNAKGDPNKIQAGFAALLKNEKKMRGFTDEERAAIKRASENSTPQSLLTLASKFGININKGVSGNTLPFAGALTAKVLGAERPLQAGVIAAGTGAGYGRKLASRGAAEKALQKVEARKTGLSTDQAIGSQGGPLSEYPQLEGAQ